MSKDQEGDFGSINPELSVAGGSASGALVSALSKMYACSSFDP